MFQTGDLVIYGSTGVCRVEDITRPNLSGADRNKLYYVLRPLHQDGIIYTPVENEKVPIRPIISSQEAEALIAMIPTIQAQACHASTTQALTQHYQSAVRSHSCWDLVEMLMSIYRKRQQAEAQNRHLGLVDERYMKQAERLLYGELSAALDIPFDEVQPYLARRIHALQKTASPCIPNT